MTTRVIEGRRVGALGRIRAACSAVIFDPSRERIFLTRRADNGLWCLPGGKINPGEDVSEACAREVWEETGLRASIKRLIGVYSSPDWLVEYPDGNRVQTVALCFEVTVDSGQAAPTAEVSEFGFFSASEIERLDLMLNHLQRLQDAFAQQECAFIR